MSSGEWHDDWAVRPCTFDDADTAVDMFNARSMHFYGENQTTAEDMIGWWKSPRFDLATDSQAVFDSQGRMIAWAHSGDPGEPYVAFGIGVIVHPEHADCDELWDRLFAWAVGLAKDRLPKAAPDLRVSVFENAMEADTARRGGAERAGFKIARVSNAMRIDLDHETPEPVWPTGVLVRSANVEDDLEAMCMATREAFRDHWGYVEEPLDQDLEGWRSWTASLGERLDPSLWFLACDGDEIAGLGLFSTRIGDDATRSYVESLSVRPGYRKRGIALALLRHGFKEVAGRDYKAVELDMDSENLTGALRLYERAGFRVIRRTLSYELVLREGKDLATRVLPVS